MTTGAPLPMATLGMFTKGLELDPPPIMPSSQINVKKPSTAPATARGLLRSKFLSAGGTNDVVWLLRAA
jgi:hypothetical protein